jgi:hypothetical protein
MSREHDEPGEEYEADEAPRSIFSVLWFRVLLVILALGLVGVIGIPYVLDVVNMPPPMTASVTSPPSPDVAAPRAVTTPAEPAKAPSPTPVPPPTATTAATPKSAPAADKPAEPARAAAPAEPSRRVVPEKAAEQAPASAPAKPAPRAKLAEAAKPADPSQLPAARAERVASTRPASPDAREGAGGDYFVQVGAFRDEDVARRVATRLREQRYPVTESVKRVGGAPADPPRNAPSASIATSGDRYDVLVSGGAATEINTKLAAKGLASEPAGDAVRIRPSLPLRDAVALSKDLGSEGFKVQVRRGGSGPAPAAPAPAGAAAVTIHRVRVGGYPDRAAAQGVLRELRDKGYDGFIAKGRD